MAAIQFRQRRVRRWWYLGVTATAFVFFAVFWVAASSADSAGGCDFAPTGTTPSCLGPLAGSTFAGGDGNLLATPSTFGSTDWVNVAGLNHASDLPTGKNDNSFGQGTKEDGPAVSVVNGSIPNNKSDLTRFYESSEAGSNGHELLYLGWERANTLGTANMDFEINHAATPGFNAGTTGPVTLNRTAGDLLVTFDFTNGGGRPSLAILRWLTAAAGNNASQCFSSSTLPCWGNRLALDGSDSIAAVNNVGSVSDPLFPGEPNAQNPVASNQFGETAIDLNAAGVFQQGICSAFGSAFVKSRSSASFTAEMKDFIAPVPVNISNCGRIIIRKKTSPSPDPTSTQFAYSTTGGLSPSAFNLKNGEAQDYGSQVQQGSYSVTESNPGPNFVLSGVDCSASSVSNGSSTSIVGAKISITLKPNDIVDCTYTNTLQQGAIKITKTSSKAAATPLAGAKFHVTGPGNTDTTLTTGSDGTACIDHLQFGSYSVTETAAPTGYSIDDSSTHSVSVSANSTCGDGNEVAVSATDTPLTDVLVKASSETPGGTKSQITCTDSSSANIGDSPSGNLESAQVTANGLKPGTYNCTIVVDP